MKIFYSWFCYHIFMTFPLGWLFQRFPPLWFYLAQRAGYYVEATAESRLSKCTDKKEKKC